MNSIYRLFLPLMAGCSFLSPVAAQPLPAMDGMYGAASEGVPQVSVQPPAASVLGYKADGQPFYLAVQAEMPHPWHAYYRNPGTVGIPMEAALQPVPGFKVSGPYWSLPMREVSEIGVAYAYAGTVTIVWKVEPLADAPDKAEFKIDLNWQVCREGQCANPEQKAVSLPLAKGDEAPAPSWGGWEKKVAGLDAPSWLDAARKPLWTENAADKTVTLTWYTRQGVKLDPAKVQFFSWENSILPTAAQKLVEKSPGEYELTMVRNDGSDMMYPLPVSGEEEEEGNEETPVQVKPLEKLQGLLVADGQGAILDLPASREAVPAVVPADSSKADAKPSKPATAAKGTAWHYAWEPWSKEKVDRALADGRPVFVDFTAKWCATCLTNKKYGYSDEVKALFRKGNVLLLRADKTRPNAAIDAELRLLDRSSIPVNVLYMPGKAPAITKEIFSASYLESFLQDHLFGDGKSGVSSKETYGIWAIFGSLFLGGLILNLMPCVFPVIGLKILSFVEMGGGDRKKVFAHSMTFTLGILISFWILTLVIFYLRSLPGGENQSWGAWLQNPWVIYGVILVFLTMGLSMYGVFEIGVGATGAGGSLQSRKGYVGSFFSGLLATVVATPCSAPLLGPVMASVMALDEVLMVAAMTCMALGLAFPYLLMGAFPALIKALPKPGAWMESLKQGMSFLLLAAVGFFVAVYNAFFIDSTELAWVYVSLVVIAAGWWVYGRWCPIYREKRTRLIGAVVAAVLIGVGIWGSMPDKRIFGGNEPAEQVEP